MFLRARVCCAPAGLGADEAVHLGDNIVQIWSFVSALVHASGHELPEATQRRVGQATHLFQHVAQAESCLWVYGTGGGKLIG